VEQWLSERQLDGGIDLVPLPDGVPGELRLCGKRAIADGRFAHPSMPWSMVVCLCQRHELANRYPAYVDWLDDPTSSSVWWPIHDLGAAPVDATVPFVDELAVRLRFGERLLVHCAAGIGRAGTTAVCVLIRLGMPMTDALATVRASRPMAGPEAGPQLDLVRAVAAAS